MTDSERNGCDCPYLSCVCHAAEDLENARLRERVVGRELEHMIDYIPADGRNRILYESLRKCIDRSMAVLDTYDMSDYQDRWACSNIRTCGHSDEML
jgi:hypothetical protein